MYKMKEGESGKCAAYAGICFKYTNAYLKTNAKGKYCISCQHYTLVKPSTTLIDAVGLATIVLNKYNAINT